MDIICCDEKLEDFFVVRQMQMQKQDCIWTQIHHLAFDLGSSLVCTVGGGHILICAVLHFLISDLNFACSTISLPYCPGLLGKGAAAAAVDIAAVRERRR